MACFHINFKLDVYECTVLAQCHQIARQGHIGVLCHDTTYQSCLKKCSLQYSATSQNHNSSHLTSRAWEGGALSGGALCNLCVIYVGVQLRATCPLHHFNALFDIFSPQMTLRPTGYTPAHHGRSAALTPNTRPWSWRRSSSLICT